MITINEFKETESSLYNNEGEFVGHIKSDLQLNDVRIQIKEQKVKGYYIVWRTIDDDKKPLRYIIKIDSDGNLECWPKDFYSLYDEQLEKLL